MHNYHMNDNVIALENKKASLAVLEPDCLESALSDIYMVAFDKALALIGYASQIKSPDAFFKTLDMWIESGLITNAEKESLKLFYGA